MPSQEKLIQLHPEATTELRDSAVFYGERNPKAKEDFKRRLRETLRSIAEDPERFPEIGLGVRRALLKQFPFSVIYIVREKIIWVVAIAHGKRRPGYWRERL